MALQTLAVLQHPQRELIDQLLNEGVSLRDISKRVPGAPGYQAIKRYKDSLPRFMASHGITIPSQSAISALTTPEHALTIPEQPSQPDQPPASSLSQINTFPVIPTPSQDRSTIPGGLRHRQEKLAQIIEETVEKAKDAQRVVRDKLTGELRAVGPDLKVMAPLIREYDRNIRLEGEITGELTAGNTTNLFVQIVAGAAGHAPAEGPYNREADVDCIDITKSE